MWDVFFYLNFNLCPTFVIITGIYVMSSHHIMWSWWRHQMETFSALLAICAGNSPVTGECPTQRPVMRSFDVFFDLRLNKWLSKHSWGWWFETPSYPLWHHCNAYYIVMLKWWPNVLCQYFFLLMNAWMIYNWREDIFPYLIKTSVIQNCFLPKGSYAYPSSVIFFLWSEICIE